MKKIIICFGTLILAGCIGPHGAMNALPPISSDKNAGDVYIVRNGNIFGSGVNYRVTLDTREILGIGTNEYTKFKLEKGEHKIGVICKGGWTPGAHINEKSTNIESGKSYYFMARAGGVCAVIEPLSESEGQKYVSGAKYIPL